MDVKKGSPYLTENYGLFIGFLSMPLGKEKKFYEYEIVNLFKAYKRRILSNIAAPSADHHDFNQFLYKPKGYFLFGNLDLVVFSIVDDFSLATRSFHPFSKLILENLPKDEQEYRAQNYTYHVISGIAPDLKYIDPEEPTLIEKAQATFLNSKKDQLPYLGITSIKLNNALLIGEGHLFVDLAIRAIRSILILFDFDVNISVGENCSD